MIITMCCMIKHCSRKSFSLVWGHFCANKLPLKHLFLLHFCLFFYLWKVHKIKNALKPVVLGRHGCVHTLNKHIKFKPISDRARLCRYLGITKTHSLQIIFKPADDQVRFLHKAVSVNAYVVLQPAALYLVFSDGKQAIDLQGLKLRWKCGEAFNKWIVATFRLKTTRLTRFLCQVALFVGKESQNLEKRSIKIKYTKFND